MVDPEPLDGELALASHWVVMAKRQRERGKGKYKRKKQLANKRKKQLADSRQKIVSSRTRNGSKVSSRSRNGLKRGVVMVSSFGLVILGLLLAMKRKAMPDLIGLDSVDEMALVMLIIIFMSLLFASFGGRLDKDEDGNWAHKGDWSGWGGSGGGS